MKPIIIFGDDDVARLAHWYFSHDTVRRVEAFCVDREYLHKNFFLSLPVLPFDEAVLKYPPNLFDMFVAIGYSDCNRNRERVYTRVKEHGYHLVSYVSSKCMYLSENPPGENCFILEGNIIQPYASIGNNVTVWSGSHIGHDSCIDAHVFVASHVIIAGHVHVMHNSFLGVNATIRDKVTIAPFSIVGASSFIDADTTEEHIYFGTRSKSFRAVAGAVKI